MKTFLGLRDLFLCFSMIWTCAGPSSVLQVQCSKFWFYARIKPTIFHNVYMSPNEAFLGDDCPVNHFWLDAYYGFFYPVYDCGITNIALQEIMVLKTKIKYMSMNTNDRAEMPVLCVIRNQHPLLKAAERRDYGNSATEWKITVNMSSADQVTKMASITKSRENLNVTFLCVTSDVLREKLEYSYPH